jgi:aspartate/methionine/tyrosine aminotransferase
VVVVHPNNPTGSFVHPDDATELVSLCHQHGWALIADEVFLPFPLAPVPGSDRSFAATNGCLTFTLGGLSKSVGLPQAKLAWIVVSGPPSLTCEAMERLDHVADTYLSVSTPVALAAESLLEAGRSVHAAISARCRANLGSLGELVAGTPAVTVLEPAGGWSVVLRVPTVIDEETLTLRLLEEHRVAVFPGYFFDFPAAGYLVLSLLVPEGVFTAGVERVLEVVSASL